MNEMKRKKPKILRWIYVKGKRKLRQAGLRERQWLKRLREKAFAIAEKNKPLQNPVTAKLLKRLTSAHEAERERAFSDLHTEEALAPIFIEMMAKDPAAEVRMQAAMSLKVLRCQEALPKLIQRLKLEKDEGVRRQIVQALGKMASSEGEHALFELLSREEKQVRADAAHALALRGSQKAADLFMEKLKNPSNPDFLIAFEALKVMANRHPRLNYRKAIPPALKLLKKEAKGNLSTANHAAIVLAASCRAMTKKESLECMELIRTALETVHNMPPEKEVFFPEEPDEFRQGMLYSFTRSMVELARDRIRRSAVPAADPGFKEKVAFARRQLEPLNERKRDILLYALISQPKRWLQVPEPSGEGERQRAKIDFLQNLKKQAEERSLEEVILIMGVGKKGAKK